MVALLRQAELKVGISPPCPNHVLPSLALKWTSFQVSQAAHPLSGQKPTHRCAGSCPAWQTCVHAHKPSRRPCCSCRTSPLLQARPPGPGLGAIQAEGTPSAEHFEVLISLMIYFTIALRMLNNSNAVNSQGIQSVSQKVLENKQRMHCQRL